MPVDGASWKSGAGASDLGVCSPSGRLYKNWVHNWVKEIFKHVYIHFEIVNDIEC